MWIVLLQPLQIERNGVPKRYSAGTQISIGKMDAMKLVQQGKARAVDRYVAGPGSTPTDAGIVALRDKEVCETMISGLPIVDGPARVEFGRTMIWQDAALRADLVAVGWKLLDKWQAAVPLWSYRELACNVSTDEDREQTKQVIRDLRVPMYDVRLMFLQRCDDTIRLIDLWNQEKEKGDARLAFLRAYYTVKPVLCALPTVWTGKA